MSRDVVCIHYLHPAEDGPIATGPGGVDDPHEMISKLNSLGPIKEQKLRFACHPTGVQSHWHRGTAELARGAGEKFVVTCPECLKSQRFLDDVAKYDAVNGPGQMFDAQGKCC
jgi:hypothetical protein